MRITRVPSNSVFENVFPMNDEANNKRIKRILWRPLLPACFSTLCKWKTTTKWSTTTTFNWWKVTTWSILTTKLIRLLRSRDYFTLRPLTGCLRQRTVTMMDSFVRGRADGWIIITLVDDFKWNFAAFCWPKGVRVASRFVQIRMYAK